MSVGNAGVERKLWSMARRYAFASLAAGEVCSKHLVCTLFLLVEIYLRCWSVPSSLWSWVLRYCFVLHLQLCGCTTQRKKMQQNKPVGSRYCSSSNLLLAVVGVVDSRKERVVRGSRIVFSPRWMYFCRALRAGHGQGVCLRPWLLGEQSSAVDKTARQQYVPS